MSPRALAAVCIVVLLLAFAIDLVTPQLFVAAILLDIPIVLSTYAGNRRFTTGLVAAALVANIVAGYINGLHAGGVWDAVGLGDRALAALSIILVGLLGLAVHSGAERSGGAIVLAEEAWRERELRRAVEKIRGSLSEELVEREIVRQACQLVNAPKASFYLAAGAAGWATRFDASADSPEVTEVAERPRSELQSILIRALETQEPVQVSQDDAMGRLVLDGLAARGALVVPLVDGDVRTGVLLVALDREAVCEDPCASCACSRRARRSRLARRACSSSWRPRTTSWLAAATSSATSSTRWRTTCAPRFLRPASPCVKPATVNTARCPPHIERCSRAALRPTTSCSAWPRRCCWSRSTSRASGAWYGIRSTSHASRGKQWRNSSRWRSRSR